MSRKSSFRCPDCHVFWHFAPDIPSLACDHAMRETKRPDWRRVVVTSTGTNMAGTVEQKLAAQGVTLHEPPSPVANYVGFVRTGNLLFVSGQVCVKPDGKLIAKGKL